MEEKKDSRISTLRIWYRNESNDEIKKKIQELATAIVGVIAPKDNRIEAIQEKLQKMAEAKRNTQIGFKGISNNKSLKTQKDCDQETTQEAEEIFKA